MATPKKSSKSTSKPVSETRTLGLAPGKHKAKPDSVEHAEAIFNSFIKYSGKAPATKHSSASSHKKSDLTKIVLINDLHVPYHNEEALAQVISQEAHDTDLLIIGGDLLDLFSVSRYDRFSVHHSLQYEFTQGKAVLNTLAANFKQVKIIPGNHDERWKKHLIQRRGVTPFEIDAMNTLAKMTNHDEEFDISDPIYCLTRDLANVELVKPAIRDYAKFGFFMQQGDVIVSHAEKFSRVPNQAAAAASFWFQSYAIPAGLCKPFKVMVQTHSHQFGITMGDFGVWNIENGCLCKTPDYAGNPKLMGAPRSNVLGYTVLYQDALGITDMVRSRIIPII
jgi:predicted phosphodiesterase